MIDYHRTLEFIKNDWHSNPVRLCLETYQWLMNVAIAFVFTYYSPEPPPLMLVYPAFLSTLAVGMYSGLSRESFGIFASALTIFVIDSVGYYYVLLKHWS